jgi:hypothetical protein
MEQVEEEMEVVATLPHQMERQMEQTIREEEEVVAVMEISSQVREVQVSSLLPSHSRTSLQLPRDKYLNYTFS